MLALSGAAAFMTTLDASIVNISLPTIARAFGVPVTGSLEWVLIGYLVVIAATLLSLGRLADMLGRKPIFLAGVALFSLGSALCGAAPTLVALIGARLLQGLGATCIFAVNMAMVTQAFPAAERGRALGINAVLVALGVSTGPTVGGIITQYLTWRWIFYVNVPLALVALLVAARALTERAPRQRQRFDPAGAALLGLGLTLLMLGLSVGQEWGWTSFRLVAVASLGVVALASALVVESRVPSPVVDLKLLRNRVFASANASFGLAMLALFAVGFLLPFYLEELRGLDTLQAGLLLTPMSVAVGVVAPVSGMLADRFGSRWLAPIGLLLACVGLVLLSQLDAASSDGDLVWRLLLTGVGQGLFMAPNTRAIMGAAPPGEQGIASSTLATVRVIGQSLSVALGGAVFASLGGAAAGATLATQRAALTPEEVTALQQTFTTGLHGALVVSAAVAACGVLAALVRGEGDLAHQEPPPSSREPVRSQT
ncbi:MAG: MFS transporter [Chloroflexi bacterium]|nr:MFS transporter [Chloroflexota bacterium]